MTVEAGKLKLDRYRCHRCHRELAGNGCAWCGAEYRFARSGALIPVEDLTRRGGA